MCINTAQSYKAAFNVFTVNLQAINKESNVYLVVYEYTAMSIFEAKSHNACFSHSVWTLSLVIKILSQDTPTNIRRVNMLLEWLQPATGLSQG